MISRNKFGIEKKSKVIESCDVSHYSHLRSDYFDDLIREPELKPLENSYYPVEEIEKKIMNQAKPSFKDCFDVNKEVINLRKKDFDWLATEEYELFRK